MAECTLEAGPTTVVDAAVLENLGQGGLTVQCPYDLDHIGVLEEDEFARSVVIGEGTERFWPQRDLVMQGQATLEHGGDARATQ